MYSTKQRLVNTITVVMAIMLTAILLATDIGVDSWLTYQFNQSLKDKALVLVSMVKAEKNQLEFDFSGEFMPEFERQQDPEYFQLWYDGKVLAKSNSLSFYPINELPKIELSVGQSIITQWQLPDGRDGRVYTVRFIPQLTEATATRLAEQPHDTSMLLSLAVPTTSLEQMLLLVDLLFFVSTLLTLLAMRIAVRKIVSNGLAPLEQLKQQLETVNIQSGKQHITIKNPTTEIQPIIDGLNHFIGENQALLNKEKRLTSNISHELKTPITELINLTEIAIKYPDDKEIIDTYKEDVLSISNSMKTIVQNLLLLQRTHGPNFKLDSDEITIATMLHNALVTMAGKYPNAQERVSIVDNSNNLLIYCDKFSLDIILANLLDNALYYSPQQSKVLITVDIIDKQQLHIRLVNDTQDLLDKTDLTQLFDPLWQKDPSRTATQRHGLGLSIVQSLCQCNGFTLSVTGLENGRIAFDIKLPLKFSTMG